ncbi:MAG: hypothetical protein R3A48_27895 [Polyangiales bacterium]
MANHPAAPRSGSPKLTATSTRVQSAMCLRATASPRTMGRVFIPAAA